jgi:hypothetical protein
VAKKTAKAERQDVAKRASAVSLNPEVGEDRVRTRAYEIYLERGDNPGDAVSDWLAAEHELNEVTGAA